VGGESSEALSAAASDSEQQTVAKRLSNNATNTTQMFDCVDEQNEMHLGRVDLIILVQILVQRSQHLHRSHSLLFQQLSHYNSN